jgi:6-pyruvoyltetrahydropterin/6-carboxytetrahydropterin synthase
MKTKIAKDFYWEMSHRLPFHKGPCRNIHGHSYKIRVEVTGELNEDGMVLDYYDLKLVFNPIIELLDHSFVVDKGDKLMIDFLKENELKYHIIEKFTTAENLAEYIYSLVKPEIKSKYKNISILTIRLYETEDVFAEVSEEL